MHMNQLQSSKESLWDLQPACFEPKGLTQTDF